MIMENILRHLHVEPDIACTFMATFARMEYALKSTRFALGDGKRVDPAWDRFANEINHRFLQLSDTEIVEAKAYLLDHPPRKQVLLDNRVAFADQVIDITQSQAQQVLLMVRTVRNNLFHGGKYLPNGEAEEGRNSLLIRRSLCVLLACSGLDEQVMSSFER